MGGLCLDRPCLGSESLIFSETCAVFGGESAWGGDRHPLAVTAPGRGKGFVFPARGSLGLSLKKMKK